MTTKTQSLEIQFDGCRPEPLAYPLDHNPFSSGANQQLTLDEADTIIHAALMSDENDFKCASSTNNPTQPAPHK